MNVTLCECHFMWMSLYMNVTLYECHFIWMSLYMNVTLYECHFIWMSLYVNVTLYECHFMWMSLYMNVTLYECHFIWRPLDILTISRSVLLIMRNVSDKMCTENQNTHFVFNKSFFPRKSCGLWDNVGECGTAGQATGYNIIRRMRIACLITKSTDTHSEYVLFTAFLQEQWLEEDASWFRLYVHCLS